MIRTFALPNFGGLHARPAVKLTMLAKSFGARIEMSARDEERWVDAKSVLRVIGLRIGPGDTFHLRAGGDDAEEALSALAALAERRFDEPDEDGPRDNAEAAP